MKKIAILLVALMLCSAVFADVAVGGWFQYKGELYSVAGSDDATTQLGAYDTSLTFTYTGENFGANTTLETWSGDFGGASGAPTLENTYLYSMWLDGVLKLQAGVRMFNMSFAPSSGLQGQGIFGDPFGIGLGKFNYEANGNAWTGKPTGLYAEVATSGLTLGVFLNDTQAARDTFVRTFEEGFIGALKYEIEGTGTVYAGYATKNGFDNGALWLAADLSLVEGLTSALKFEMLSKTSIVDPTPMWGGGTATEDPSYGISALLGYSVPDTVAVNSEINFYMVPEIGAAKAYNVMVFDLNVAPVVEMVYLAANASLEYETEEVSGDEQLAMDFSITVGKTIGNVGNKVYLVMDGDHDSNSDHTFAVKYDLSVWF